MKVVDLGDLVQVPEIFPVVSVRTKSPLKVELICKSITALATSQSNLSNLLMRGKKAAVFVQ